MTVVPVDFAAARRDRERDALDEMVDRGFDALRQAQDAWTAKEGELLNQLRHFSKVRDLANCRELTYRLLDHYDKGLALGFTPGYVTASSPGDDWRPGA